MIKPCFRLLISSVLVLVLQTVAPVGLQYLGFEQLSLGQVLAEEEKKPATRKTPALSNAVYEKLSAAQQASEAGNLQEAIAILDDLKNQTGKKELNSYEKANLWNFYAFIYYSKEMLPEAIKAYEMVLKQPDIPEAMEISTMYSLSQLYFVIEDYPKAIKSLTDWFKVAENPAPDAYIFLGQAYFQIKDYDNALKQIEKGMQIAKAKGKELKENWFLLLRFLYNEKNNTKKQLEVLQYLVKTWPKKDYWVGLSGIYGELNQENNQLHALEAAYVQGLLDRDSELVSLAQLFAANGMPYKAAKVMEKGLNEKKVKNTPKNIERLGEYWRRAQETEKALPYLETAARDSEDGEPYIRLAYLYFSLDKYQEAAKAAAGGLKKGGLKRPMEAQMLLGQSLFYVDKYDEARSAFQKILADTDKKNARNRQTAKQWMQYMEREILRQKEISRYLQS
jgi:tetratricopeptide (TPR) repeat protein